MLSLKNQACNKKYPLQFFYCTFSAEKGFIETGKSYFPFYLVEKIGDVIGSLFRIRDR